jgi:hypothetical protein
MVLAGHSNASYISETNACSRAGGHFFMSNNNAIPSNNGAILMILQIIEVVMSSTVEAEIELSTSTAEKPSRLDINLNT